MASSPHAPSTLARRLVAQRDALALLLGAEFPAVLAATRSRVSDHMTRLGTDNAFVAALDLVQSLDPLKNPYPPLLLMAALDLHEREACHRCVDDPVDDLSACLR